MKTLLPAAIIFGILSAADNSAFAQIWTSNGIPGMSGWSAVTMSADGTVMTAAGSTNIYISTNSGATWMPTSAPGQYWAAIASSADGSKLIAAAVPAGIYAGGIYTSTNFGTSWSSNNVLNPNHWQSVACSADGTRLIAAEGNNYSGPIYLSTNSGNSWAAANAPISNWCSVASSADGSKLLAGTFGGSAYLSTNTGATWILQTNLPAARWTTMALSADGRILVAVAYDVGSGPGGIYTSTNSGAAWTRANTPTSQYYWPTFCSSADGTKWVAIGYWVFYSTNSGNTWTSNSSPNLFAKWTSIASSADGNKLALVAGEPFGIYTSYSIPKPQVNFASSSSKLFLSWLVPSTNFVLQQNSDLITTDWVTLTNAPALNLTNLQDEVTLSPTNSSGFFRLISQ